VRRLNLLYGGTAQMARDRALTPVLETLRRDMEQYVAEASPRRIFVHAGVVVYNGRAIVLPGPSYAGKTTLVAKLVEAGATYLSDEYAVLDARGRVHPFRRRLVHRMGGNEGPMADLFAPAIEADDDGPFPVGLVAMTTYKEGGRWRPRGLSTGEGILALYANTVNVRRQPKRTFFTLQRAAMHATFLKGPRGEAGDMVDALLSRIDGAAAKETTAARHA
jgi:hypothetical protein